MVSSGDLRRQACLYHWPVRFEVVRQPLMGIETLSTVNTPLSSLLTDKLQMILQPRMASCWYWYQRVRGRSIFRLRQQLARKKSRIHTNLPVSLVHEPHSSLTHFRKEDRVSLPKTSSHWSKSASECGDNRAISIEHNLHRRDPRGRFRVLN